LNLKLDIAKFLPFLAGKGVKELVAIDLNGNTLKVVYVKVAGFKFEIANFATRNISGLNDADIVKTINSSVHDLNTKNPYIVAIVPSNLVITKNIEIPSTNPQEIKDIINLQAGRHTPYSREEIIVDYVDIGTYKHSYTKILLVIIARNIVKRQFDLLERAGLRLEKVFFAPEALAWASSKIAGSEVKDSPVAIIHIDENFTDFVIALKGKAAFVRSIPIGVQHLMSERERFEIRFADEVKRSLEAYQIENIDKNPTNFVLTGATEDVKELEITLSSVIGFPAKVVPYLRSFSLSNEAFRSASASKKVSFLSLVASLLGLNDMKVELVPEEIKVKKLLEERGRDLVKMGVLIFTIFAIVCFILVNNMYFKLSYLRRLESKYKNLTQESSSLEKDYARVVAIRGYLSSRGYSLEVLSEIYNIIPLEIELSDIRFDEQGKFTLRGSAQAMSTVFTFADNMEKAKYFKDVKTKYTSKRKEGSRELTDFEIVCTLKKEGA